MKMGEKTKIPHCRNSSKIQSHNRITRGKIDTLHDRSLSWPGTGTSIKSGEVKRVLWAFI